MKTIKNTAIALVLSLSAIGAAQAITLDAVPGVSSGNLSASVKDGVATLSGHTDDASERQLAERYLAKMDGVDKVINLASFN